MEAKKLKINFRKIMAFFIAMLMALTVVMGIPAKSFAASPKYYVPKTLKADVNQFGGTTSFDQDSQRIDSVDFGNEELFMALANESTDRKNNRFLAWLIGYDESAFTSDAIRFGKIREIDFYETASGNSGKKLTSKYFFNIKGNKVVNQVITDRDYFGGSVIYNYSYNSKGDLTRIESWDTDNFGDRSHTKITVTYDSKGRISKITDSTEAYDGAKIHGTMYYSSYNKDGLPTVGKEGNLKETWSLNADCQPTKQAFSEPSLISYSTFNYDANGHLRKIANYGKDEKGKWEESTCTYFSDYYAI